MTGSSLAEKLLETHTDAHTDPGAELRLRVEQALVHDTTGPMIALQLMAMGVREIQVPLTAAYVDHQVLQVAGRSTDEHGFLRSAAAAYGMWFSPPGGGISHVAHLEAFAVPGGFVLGADSHTCGIGGLGALALGAGGLDVALALAEGTYSLRRPEVWRIELTGELPPWTSAKDLVLELLRRIRVGGAAGFALEYGGTGVAGLSVMDRYVVANMGAELGAVFSVFPSDARTAAFLTEVGRAADWRPLDADDDARYARTTDIDLSGVEPMIARPGSPDDVVRVADVAGLPVGQCYIGSSANPGHRDYAVVADMVAGRQVADGTSLDINPASRHVLRRLVADGSLLKLVQAGARLHDTGCNGCIGMGQAPGRGTPSLRTVPRNFRGRSGTADDEVYLVSPETAAASALTGVITDPRETTAEYPWALRSDVEQTSSPRSWMTPPPPAGDRPPGGPLLAAHMRRIPPLPGWVDRIEAPVALKVGDNTTTDSIVPAGQELLPLRSDVEATSAFVFRNVDGEYVDRALGTRTTSGHVLVAGRNYGQGSSRELAALAPRYLGLRVVLARSFARIYRDNLVNFGVLPLELASEDGFDALGLSDVVVVDDVAGVLSSPTGAVVHNLSTGRAIAVRHGLSDRQIEILRTGGVLGAHRRSEGVSV